MAEKKTGGSHDHNEMDHTVHDHMKMDHGEQEQMSMDHRKTAMDHSKHEHMMMDHSNMTTDHSKHDQMGMGHDKMDMDHNSHGQMSMDHSGHGEMAMDHSHMGHMDMGSFKKKFWLSLVLAIPIILLSPMMGINLPFQFTFAGSEWIVLILATILFFYGGQPFLSGAKMELKMKSPAMMTLIAMGITVSYFYSLYAFVANKLNPHLHVMDFFWELATLIVIMLLGHWIEMSAVSNASNALQKLAELLPDKVTRITSGETEEVSLQAVKNDDILLVKAGDKMPTDGVIVKGSTIVDESAVTGESKGVKKTVDDTVIGGSVNGDGTIQLKVTGTGQDGYLAKVMEMVKNAQSQKSRLENLSDKVAKWLFYIALAIGIITFFVWLFVSDSFTALERMVTVLVIACPHALGLAIPLVVARSTSIAAKNGLLLKNRNALEQSKDLEYVLLDKTGTLTEGKFTVTGVETPDSNFSKEEILKYIGALEESANHPLATGIMNYLKLEKIQWYSAEDVENINGVGIKGVVQNEKTAIVNAKEIERLGLTYDETLLTKYQEQGNTISFLVINQKLAGIIALGDKVKPEAKQFIAELKKRGITPVMLTGDNKKAASAVAKYLGLDEYFGELLPDDKEKIVKKYVDEDKKVMMVGDGINDAPALTSATVGVAIGAGTDVAIESADVVLTNSNPEDLLHFIDLADQTRKKMIQNLWWGAGYNIIALPLAAGVLAPWGIILSPAVGAILMSLSTVIVALNALTLKLHK